MIFGRPHEVVTDDVFLELPGLIHESEVFLKLEGLNPAGSIKLKPAVAMIERAEEKGQLSSGSRIIESSSGSLGIAIAMVAASKGYPFTCVVDPNISRQSLDTIRALGADVIQVTDRDANGGYLGTRIATIYQQLQVDPDLVWLNQYANPANVAAHARATATSMLRELGRIDYLFVGSGTTGTLMGCVKQFRTFSPQTKIVAVDSVGSVTFGGKAGPRYIPGLGTSRRPELYREGAADHTVLIPEVDAVRMCRHLPNRYGLLCGGSTGSVVAAIWQHADHIPSGSRVAALCPDMGDRYVETIYNDTWAMETYGPDALIPLIQPEAVTV